MGSCSDRWFMFGFKTGAWISSGFSLQQKNEVTEVLRSALFCHSGPRSGEESASCRQCGSRECLHEGRMNALEYRDADGIMIMLEAMFPPFAVIARSTVPTAHRKLTMASVLRKQNDNSLDMASVRPRGRAFCNSVL